MHSLAKAWSLPVPLPPSPPRVCLCPSLPSLRPTLPLLRSKYVISYQMLHHISVVHERFEAGDTVAYVSNVDEF